MEFKNLIFEKVDNVAVVKINRIEKMNALNSETIDELGIIFTELNKDENVDAIVLTGNGEKAFVAGADIKELNKMDVISGQSMSEKGQKVFSLIENLSKPVIAAVNGYALGGGCELAMSCHFRYASENAVFGQPEVNLGIIPGYGGTQRMSRLINPGRAMEFILTGDMIKSDEALLIGLVNKVFAKEELLEQAIKTAKKIASKGQIAVALSIKAVNATKEISQEDGLKYEASLFGLCCGTQDFMEGTTAFIEKREAKFAKK